MNDSESRLHAVLVTYNRPDELGTYLECLLSQTRRIDNLIVIDNSGLATVEEAVKRYKARGGQAEYVNPGTNLGPAGGIALGMSRILAVGNDADWIFSLDDDDPPTFSDAIERIANFALQMIGQDPSTGGVAPSGGRFDRRSGRVIRIGDSELTGPVQVDHFPGNGLPCYRVEAVRSVGVFDADLFFGFEELEYGLRMTDRGFRLYAHGNLWRAIREQRRRSGALDEHEIRPGQRSARRATVDNASWRRYYSLRNLIFILRRLGRTSTALKVTFTRGLLKPLANLLVAPSVAWTQLKLNTRSIRDGWSGRMGLVVEPTPTERPPSASANSR
jgi:GT2 family glycosyltransferase